MRGGEEERRRVRGLAARLVPQSQCSLPFPKSKIMGTYFYTGSHTNVRSEEDDVYCKCGWVKWREELRGNYLL